MKSGEWSYGVPFGDDYTWLPQGGAVPALHPFDKKRFSPHITLLRKASGALPGIVPEPASMTVTALSLMRSDRGRNGMIYTELGSVEADGE